MEDIRDKNLLGFLIGNYLKKKKSYFKVRKITINTNFNLKIVNYRNIYKYKGIILSMTYNIQNIGTKVTKGIAALGLVGVLTACQDDAKIASLNISKAADNFEVARRIVFFNGITDNYIMEVVGRCSVASDNQDRQLEITCKTGPNQYKKDYFGKSDNTAYFVEQLDPIDVSVYHHRKTFKPQSIIPDIDFRGSFNDNPLRNQK